MQQTDPARTAENQFRTRRRLVAIGGVTLIASTVFGATGCASALSRAGLPVFPRAEPGPIAPQTVAGVPVGTLGGGTKPIFVAPRAVSTRSPTRWPTPCSGASRWRNTRCSSR
jgi:hypothetical protein